MNESIEMTILLDTYEKLLTENQIKIMRLRFDDDLSLTEIGDICSISRQAAHDCITRCEMRLRELESALHVVEKDRKLNELILKLENDCNDSLRIMKDIAELKKLSEG